MALLAHPLLPRHALLLVAWLVLASRALAQDEAVLYGSPDDVVADTSVAPMMWQIGIGLLLATIAAALTTPKVRRWLKKWRPRSKRRHAYRREPRDNKKYEYFKGPKYTHRRNRETGQVHMLAEGHWVYEPKQEAGQGLASAKRESDFKPRPAPDASTN